MLPDGLIFLRTERISQRCGPDPASTRLFPNRGTYVLQGKALAYPEFDTFICDDFPMLRLSYPAGPASYERLGLATVWDVLRDLPDPRLVQRLMVIDFPHDEEAWIRQVSGARDLTIRAQTDRRGHIKLFRPTGERLTCAALRHEWSHLLKFTSPEEAGLFDALHDLEPLDPDVFLGAGHGEWSSSDDEIWAKLGETLVDGFASGREADAKERALAYPVRTALWGQAFARRRKGLEVAAPLGDVYERLGQWLRGQVAPAVAAQLRAAADRSDLGRAARVLKALEPIAPTV